MHERIGRLVVMGVGYSLLVIGVLFIVISAATGGGFKSSRNMFVFVAVFFALVILGIALIVIGRKMKNKQTHEMLAEIKKNTLEQETTTNKWKPANPRLSSKMSLSSLLRIFLFTSGNGQTVLSCPVATGTLADTVGAPPSDFMGKVPFDIIAQSNIGREIIQTGQFPADAWIAMSNIAPDATEKAQMGSYRTTIRPFENPTTRESGVCVLHCEI